LNYKKLILVGCISAFVALLTSIMGVAGTIIGSVISSVLYNMLTEALEKPVGQASFTSKFEWEIAYVFPLVVIALIQLLLIFALFSEMGILPGKFLNVFLSIQELTDNNLYKILGVALLVISAYPIILKPDIIKKAHGAIIAFVGLIFLFRGFVDFGHPVTELYSPIFDYFDLPIAIVALILILFVIFMILKNAQDSKNESRIADHKSNEINFSKENIIRPHHSKKHDDFDYHKKRQEINQRSHESVNIDNDSVTAFETDIDTQKSTTGINESAENIHFESNDLLDDYKK
jgi:hypothetical protein